MCANDVKDEADSGKRYQRCVRCFSTPGLMKGILDSRVEAVVTNHCETFLGQSTLVFQDAIEVLLGL